MSLRGKRSEERLATCDPVLAELVCELAKRMDLEVLCGHRGQAEQDEAFGAGRSKLRWPDGPHNATPSRAVDIAPWPVLWPHGDDDDRTRGRKIARFARLAGVLEEIARARGVDLRWGGDWDSDGEIMDNGAFDDLPHFELRR